MESLTLTKWSRRLGITIASLWLWLAPIYMAGAKPQRVPVSPQPVLVPQIGNFKGIASLAYSSDGKTLATLGEDSGPLLLWDAHTLELKRVLHGAGRGNGGEVLFTPNPKLLAINTNTDESFAVQLVDWHSGRIVRQISTARYFDNGRILARYDYDKGRVTFSEAANGRKLLSLPGPQDVYNQYTEGNFYFSPNHTRVAQPLEDSVQIFDVPRTVPRLKLRDPRGTSRPGVYGPVAFSPDGKLIATAGEDPAYSPPDDDGNDDGPDTSDKYAHSLTVKIWDAHTGKLRRILPEYGSNSTAGTPVSLLRFAPDSRHLVIGDGSRVDLLDVRTFKVLRRTPANAPYAIAPDGVHLMGAGAGHGHDREYYYGTLFDLRTGKAIKDLTAGLGSSGVCAWSKDGNWLLVGDQARNEVRVWNVRDGRSGPSWQFNEPLFGGFLPDGKVWTGSHSEVEIRESVTGKMLDSFKPYSNDHFGAYGVLVSPNGRFFVAQEGSPGSPIELYERTTKKVILSLNNPRVEVASVVFSPDEQKLAAVAPAALKPSTVYVWNLAGDLLRTFCDGEEVYKDGVADPHFLPDGKHLYASGDRGPRIYDLTTGEKRMLDPKARAFSALSDDGEWGLIAWGAVFPDSFTNFTAMTEIRDLRTNRIVRRFTSPTYQDNKAALSPDKKILARAEGGRTILYEVTTGHKLLTLVSLPIQDETKAPINWLAYTPDGFYNASPGAAAQIRWRVGDILYPAAKFERQFRQTARLKAVIAAARKP